MRRRSFLLLFVLIFAITLTGCSTAGKNLQTSETEERTVLDNSSSDIQIIGKPIKDEPIETAPEEPAPDPALADVPETGAVGWSLEDGVLTISGSDVLTKKPWEKEYHDDTVRSITKVLIGNGITDLPYSAFGDHDSLIAVAMGDGLTYVPSETFFGCTSLKQVTFGVNITFIDGGAFERCGLEEIVIPDTVTFINIGAFANCVNLEKISISASVIEIGEDAFMNCEKLTIFAPKGSYAESYARENSISFSELSLK